MDWSPVRSCGLLGKRSAFLRNFSEKLRTASVSRNLQAIGKCSNGCRDVSGQLHFRPVVLLNVRSHRVDVNQAALLAAVPEARFKFDRIVANRNDQIGCIEDSVGGLSTK